MSISLTVNEIQTLTMHWFQPLQEILYKLIFWRFWWPGFLWLLVLTAPKLLQSTHNYLLNQPKVESQPKAPALSMGEVESSNRMLSSFGHKNA